MDLWATPSDLGERTPPVTVAADDEVVREERLRSRVEAPGFLQLTAWRGRSNRRHVFIIRPAADPDLVEETAGVALAVERRPDGSSRRLDVAVIQDIGLFFLWVTAMQTRGANEIHLHRSAAPAENLAIAHSLAVGALEQAAPILPEAA